ncbi:hypothetical protein BSKO_01503 [Bryopsis sp. KO-2023]|nr:hypothetical protein BSKO_01503 [Bryopsis sp. KO-2023]
MVEDGPVKKKSRKQKQAEASKTDTASNAQEPTLSRLTARQLAVARLVSSYKYECKKVFKQVLDRQDKWKNDLELATTPAAQDMAVESNETEGKATEDIVTSPAVPAKRRRVVWKQAEREALKKWFLAFGFGRWHEIENGMHKSLKIVRHGAGDMEDACWEFVSELVHHVEGKELEYLTYQLENVKSRLPIQTSGVPWTKVQSAAKIWTRRLHLLDSITTIVEKLKDKEMMELFESSLGMVSDANPPAQWWTSKTDLCLLRGVHKHGYGNYDAVRTDPEFSWAFGQVNSKADMQVEGPNKDEQTKQDETSKETQTQWPATDLLTKRLKRVADFLNKILERNEAEEKKQKQKEKELPKPVFWSRKEKLEMVKTLMTFGMPEEMSHHSEDQLCIDWKALKQHTTFQDHPESEVQRLCEELVAEAGEILSSNEAHRKSTHPADSKKRKTKAKVSNQGEEGISEGLNNPAEGMHRENQQEGEADAMEITETPIDAFKADRVLTPQTATKLKDRLEMFSTLRKGFLVLKSGALNKGLAAKMQDLPEWWVAGVHDVDLVSGALSYGVNAWIAIERDPSLSFIMSWSLFTQLGEKLPEDCASNPLKEARRVALGRTFLIRIPPVGGKGILPDGKVLLRRLKQIVGLLKKYDRQSTSPIMPAAQPDALMMDAGTTSKSGKILHPIRQKKSKYSKKIKVDRDPSGKPILPLTLTSMLALVELGRIEWRRITFHSERHIYPIGFKTRRRYSSTIDPHGTTTYTCSILDGGTRPLFTISADDNPHLRIQNDTPSGSWADLFSRVYDARGIKKDKVVISGTDMFGLSHPTISRLIQELQNADKCTNFIPELSFHPPDRAQNEIPASGGTETLHIPDSQPKEATGMTQALPSRGQWGLQGAARVESHQYLHPGPAAISRQDGGVPSQALQLHPPHAPIMRQPASCAVPSALLPAQIGHAKDHLVPGPYHMSTTTPWLSELGNQAGLSPSLPSQFSAASNRGSGAPQGSSEQVSASTGVANQQLGYWDVLPQMGHLQHGGGGRIVAPHLTTHGVIPIQFYNRIGGGDMHRVQPGGEPGVDPRGVMPASLAHEFEAPQFGFRNPATMQRLHVMSGDGMRLSAADQQGNVEPRANLAGIPANLAPTWPVSLMGGGGLMMPQNPDVQFSAQSDSLQTAEILGDDHTSTPEG